jgi:hypothetical protein
MSRPPIRVQKEDEVDEPFPLVTASSLHDYSGQRMHECVRVLMLGCLPYLFRRDGS